MRLSSYLRRPWERVAEYVEMLRVFIKYSCRAKQDCSLLEDAVQMLMQLRHDADDLRAAKRISGLPCDLDSLGPVTLHVSPSSLPCSCFFFFFFFFFFSHCMWGRRAGRSASTRHRPFSLMSFGLPCDLDSLRAHHAAR